MWNKPTLEEIEALQLPRTKDVARKAYEYRKVYIHLFNDMEEYFVGGYDPESGEIYAYEIWQDEKFRPYGGWSRCRLDLIADRPSKTGAELTRNLNFRPCQAIDVPKIRACEERNEAYHRLFE